MGQHDEAIARSRKPFKFWFTISLLFLGVMVFAGMALLFLVELIRDAASRI